MNSENNVINYRRHPKSMWCANIDHLPSPRSAILKRRDNVDNTVSRTKYERYILDVPCDIIFGTRHFGNEIVIFVCIA